jgi:hypothetical protein
MANTTTTTSKPTIAATNEELPYTPRSPTPEEGELVEHSDAAITTIISHDPYITETLTITDINSNPVLDEDPATSAPIPIRLRASAITFAPTPPLDIPRSISPRTATALISHPAITLDKAKAIVTAIANTCNGKIDAICHLSAEGIECSAAFEEVVQAAVDARKKAQAKLAELQRRVDDLEGPECPDGFIENRGRLPHFRIPIANGYPNMQARFIRQCPGNPSCAEGTMGGLGDAIYLMEITAQGRYNPEEDPVPISEWFNHLLAAGAKNFGHVLKAARALDDWGLLADLARARALTDQIASHDAALRNLDNAREAAIDKLAATTARLALAKVNQRLATLRALIDVDGGICIPSSSHIGPGNFRASCGRGRPL